MKIQDLNRYDGIKCTTKNEAEQLCDLMHTMGLFWCNRRSYLGYTQWDSNRKEDFVYFPYWVPEGGCFGNSISALREGGTVYDVALFIGGDSLINEVFK